MKAYQCSQCAKLEDLDEHCRCLCGIDPRPSCREKGDAERCKNGFELLPEKERWHMKFYWEDKHGSRTV